MGKKIDSQLNVRIERALAAEAKLAAWKRGQTLSALVREFLVSLVKGKACD